MSNGGEFVPSASNDDRAFRTLVAPYEEEFAQRESAAMVELTPGMEVAACRAATDESLIRLVRRELSSTPAPELEQLALEIQIRLEAELGLDKYGFMRAYFLCRETLSERSNRGDQ